MNRKITQNKIVNEEHFRKVHPVNRQMLREFLPYLRTIDRSEKTIENYENCIQIAFTWNLEHNRNKAIYQWTRRDVIAFQDWLMTNNDNSPARVRGIKAAMSSLCNYIEREYAVKYPKFRNPIKQVENPVNNPVQEKTVFSETEILDLLDNLILKGKIEHSCALALALYSGRRKSELPRFLVSDFDDEHLVCDGALWKSSPIKTKGRGRQGKMLKCYTSVKFKKYLDLWMEERKRLGIESEYLLTSLQEPKQPISIITLNSWAECFSRYLGRPFYWHAIRHLTVTEFKRKGLPNEVIQQYIGWATADMVDKYNDLDADESFGDFFKVS